MYYLAEYRGLRQPVVESVNNTAMAVTLGKHYDIPVYETSVGFKYIGPKMIETGAMMGAEESGGYGFGMHLPERDGVYADLLLLDLFLHEKAAGRWPVSKALADFHELAGPSFYRRIDVHVETGRLRRLKDRLLVELRTNGPSDLAGAPVVRTDALTTNDGFKFFSRRRFVAADPVQRHRAAGAGVHRSDRRRDARRDGGRRRGARPCCLSRTCPGPARTRPGGSTSPGATS